MARRKFDAESVKLLADVPVYYGVADARHWGVAAYRFNKAIASGAITPVAQTRSGQPLISESQFIELRDKPVRTRAKAMTPTDHISAAIAALPEGSAERKALEKALAAFKK